MNYQTCKLPVKFPCEIDVCLKDHRFVDPSKTNILLGYFLLG